MLTLLVGNSNEQQSRSHGFMLINAESGRRSHVYATLSKLTLTEIFHLLKILFEAPLRLKTYYSLCLVKTEISFDFNFRVKFCLYKYFLLLKSLIQELFY